MRPDLHQVHDQAIRRPGNSRSVDVLLWATYSTVLAQPKSDSRIVTSFRARKGKRGKDQADNDRTVTSHGAVSAMHA